ncbi:MAG: hypothetical protein ACM3TT_05870 [Syntrophothermus sp.]
MDIRKVVGRRIDQVRGNLSYAAFAKAIEKSTGAIIHPTSLQKYVVGERECSQRNLQAIADFAGLPVSWFFESEIVQETPAGYFNRWMPLLNDPQIIELMGELLPFSEQEKDALLTFLEAMRLRRKEKKK